MKYFKEIAETLIATLIPFLMLGVAGGLEIETLSFIEAFMWTVLILILLLILLLIIKVCDDK